MRSEGRFAWVVAVVLLWFVVPAFAVTIVDVNLYKSGTTQATAEVAPGDTVDVDVVVTLTGDLKLSAYEMNIIDDYDFGTGYQGQGMSIASILHRVIVPPGWADLSLSTYPLSLWSTALDAAAYATNQVWDLPPGTSHVVERLTLTAPASFPQDGCGPWDNGYYVTPLDKARDPGLVFAGPGGVPLQIGQLSGICIFPEPGTAGLLGAAAVAMLSRRRRNDD